jgi:hypothetical protein
MRPRRHTTGWADFDWKIIDTFMTLMWRMYYKSRVDLINRLYKNGIHLTLATP